MPRYIREIANPLNVIRHGAVGPGGLGAVPDGYEEVEGDLPEGSVFVRRKLPKEKIEALFLKIASAADRAAIASMLAGVRTCLDLGDKEGAKALVTATTFPGSIAAAKVALLAEFD